MKIFKSEFIKSSDDYKKCPKEHIPEYAFIGRSNVGKSSLLNMLVNNKKLSKTSSKPGKTKLINHFKINDACFFVDLPGYGWAKSSKFERLKWQKMTQKFMINSSKLSLVFLLIDSRIKPQKTDIKFSNFIGTNNIPMNIIFTKTDKMNKKGLENNIELFKNQILKSWKKLPDIFLSSSINKTGRNKILSHISKINNNISYK